MARLMVMKKAGGTKIKDYAESEWKHVLVYRCSVPRKSSHLPKEFLDVYEGNF